MSGEAVSNSFMLGTATVMIGAQADLMNLAVVNSVGLVKNISLKTAPAFTELTQGVKNTVVYSVMTANKVTVDGEMYEYTGRNVTYALGLDGTTLLPPTAVTTCNSAINAPVSPALSAANITLTAATGFNLSGGDTIMVQVGNLDQCIIRKIVSITGLVATLDSGFPIGIPVGASIKKMNVIAVGSFADQPYLSAKIVGTLANGDEVVILLPKVRMTNGLNLAFKTGGFEFIPLALEVFDLVPTDPNYAYFQSVGPSGVPAKAALITSN